ncbi:unnamed protein product [Euphydryas editha]|uniref:Cytochrome P450 n=1 Tax=Euphydryas editha TaxID=104508 RepID=A0AAU9V8D1_EUPED|nr:unnamed protein product [Euphydryas editha]
MLYQFLAAVFLILLIVDRWKPNKFVKLHKELGNDWTYVPILGNILKIVGSKEKFVTASLQLASQAIKRKHKAVSIWVGAKLYVVMSDGDQVNTVLRTALDKPFIYKFTKPILGNGSVFAPVHIWHPRRKILMPSFAPRYVNNFVSVFEAESKILADQLEFEVGRGNFGCFDYIVTYSLISVCETIFGETSDTQRTLDRTFFNAFSQCLKYVTDRITKPWLHIDAIYKLLPMYARQIKYTNIVYQCIDNVIYAKRKLLAKNDAIEKADNPVKTDKSKPPFNSFLELIVKNSKNNNEKGYTHEELREEIFVLGVAGTDTLAVGTSFTMLMLAQYPDVQDKVYKEIQEILGDSDKPLEAKDLIKLTYTTAVIKESLRLYPPVSFITRHCHKDLELPSGLVLPAGCDVIINILGVQRNPDYWGEDANEFKPERFISGHVPPNGFIAFSQGARNCVGQQYAMLSMTTVLVTVLRRYRLKPATNVRRTKDNKLRLAFEVMTKEVNHFAVQVERREE